MLRAVIASWAIATAVAQPQIITQGPNVVIQSGNNGDVSFRAGATGALQSVSAMLTRLQALEDRATAMETNSFPTNVTTVQYTSNMDPTFASSSSTPNDVTVLVGRFATYQSLGITIEDRGACSGFSMRFTVVARWGALTGNGGAPQMPQIFSAGAADSNRHALVQWYFKGATNGYYYLWVYLPPWPLCGQNGQTAQPHTLTITTQASSQPGAMSFDPVSDAMMTPPRNPLNLPNNGMPPTFNYFNGNASQISRITTQIHATEADIVPTINSELNRAVISTQWTTNMDPAYAAANRLQNDLRLLVGKFAARSVLSVSVSDIGACSNFGQAFTIVGKWGVHLTNAQNPTAYSPQVFSFGTSSTWDVHNTAYNFYYKANGTDTYFLWLYIPPRPTCGLNGQTPNTHTTVVTISASTPTSTVWVNQRTATFNSPVGTVQGAPPFNAPESGNVSGIYNMPTQTISNTANIGEAVNSVLSRIQMRFVWSSNMLPSWAQQNGYSNSLGAYIGRMSVNSVVNLAISDSGWCSGTAVEYKILGRWGIHYTNYTNTPPTSATANNYPQAYSVGSASGTWGSGLTATQVFQLYFSPVSGSRGSSTYQYNLFLYMPPFPICGSNGGRGDYARNHTTVVTMRVDGMDEQAILNGTNADNDGNSLPFDYFDVNQSNILPVPSAVLDPASSPTFEAMVSQSLNRKQKTYSYTSNMDATWAQSQGLSTSLTATLGLFSTSQVVEMMVEDQGWCSGIGMSFVLVGRWGVHLIPGQQTPNEAYHPELFTFGAASEWLFNQNSPDRQVFQFYFVAQNNTANGRLYTNRYWLVLYIPPWSVCGSPAQRAETHTATVTMTVSNTPSQGLSYQDTFTPTETTPPFDYLSGNASGWNRIRAQIPST